MQGSGHGSGSGGAGNGSGGGSESGGVGASLVRLAVSLAHLEGAWVTLRGLELKHALMSQEALVQVRWHGCLNHAPSNKWIDASFCTMPDICFGLLYEQGCDLKH